MAFEIISVNPTIFGISVHRNNNIFKDRFHFYITLTNMSGFKKSAFLPILFVLVKINFTII